MRPRPLTLLRHALAVAVLPFTVTVIVPVWIGREYGVGFSVGASPGALLVQFAGVAATVIGLILFVSSLWRFAADGRGTLAPWDPPRRLVVRGPYRYVRNPMISGVVFVLAGEALMLRSVPHAIWTLVFFAINAIYIPLVEEPALRDRFGDEYAAYCNHVPRLVPTGRAWTSLR